MICECNLSQLLDTCCQSIRCYPPSQSRAGRYFTANANQARCQVSFCGSFSCLRAVNNFYVRSIIAWPTPTNRRIFPRCSARGKSRSTMPMFPLGMGVVAAPAARTLNQQVMVLRMEWTAVMLPLASARWLQLLLVFCC